MNAIKYAKNNFIGVFFLINFFWLVPFVFATAPSEIVLDYDDEAQFLSVEVKHTSHALEDHFIRKIEITHNGEEHTVKYYHRQPDPKEFIWTFPIEAQKDDVVRVKIYCKEGGTKVEELIVKEPEESSSNK